MSYSSEVSADSPSVYLRLGEASGTSMTDSSGHGRDGTYTGVTLGTTGLLVGDPNTAATFSGSAKGEIAYDSAWMNPSALTIEAIIKPSSVDGTHVIASRHNDPASWSFRTDGPQLRFLCWAAGSGGGFSANAASVTLSAGTTYHVAATASGTTVAFWINGVAAGTGTMVGMPFASTSPFRVGASFAGENFAGVIDEVAFYGTALSSTRIAAHYTAATTTPSETGTLAATLPLTEASFTGDYTPPTETGSLSATLPLTTAAFSGTYAAPPTGTFAASLPLVVADFTGTYVEPAVPSGTFAATLPLVGAAFTGDYHPLETGTIAVSLPLTTAAFTGTYTPPTITGTFAASLPVIVADFTGNAGAQTGSLAAALPLVTVAFVGSYGGPYPTDTSNSANGLSVNCTAQVTMTRPPATAPDTLVLGEKYDKSVPYPVPVMVGGRPT